MKFNNVSPHLKDSLTKYMSIVLQIQCLVVPPMVSYLAYYFNTSVGNESLHFWAYLGFFHLLTLYKNFTGVDCA